MLRYILVLFIIISCHNFINIPGCFAQEVDMTRWYVHKGTHFIIYYASDFKLSEVKALLRRAENYYDDITNKLGFRRFNFWTWDNRCKLYLYATKEDYSNNTQQPEWSRASVHIKDRVIYTYSVSGYFLDTILPHEMGHLIFREFVGYNTPLPLWLDEGIATFVEGNKGSRLARAKKIVKSINFISLKRLTAISLNNLKDPDIFYSESASIIEFLLCKYGREKFVRYCRLLQDRKNWYESLRDVYGFSNLYDMNTKWMAFLLE